MINLKFYTLDERTPEHNQEVVYLEYGSSFGCDSVGIRTGLVRYLWEDPEEQEYCYNYENPEDMYGYTLVILIDGYVLEGNNAWCTTDEYFDAIDEGIKE